MRQDKPQSKGDFSEISFKNSSDEPYKTENTTNNYSGNILLKKTRSFSPSHNEERTSVSNQPVQQTVTTPRNYLFAEEKPEPNTTAYFTQNMEPQSQATNKSFNTPGFQNKNFFKQDTNMSFRDNIESNPPSFSQSVNQISHNITDETAIYKAKIDKEYYEAQITSLKQTISEEKARYDSMLSEEKEKLRKRDQENAKFVEELRTRQKEEIVSLDEKYKSRIDILNEENRRIRNEINQEIQNERDRMNTLHKSDLEMQEATFAKNSDQQRKFFEDQNETLKKQLQQQIEFNKLASKVEVSSKQIDTILDKFFKEKERSVDLDKSTINNKEVFLKEQEEKLKETEKMIQLEKESLMKMRQDFELREIERRKENQEEKNRIEREVLRLQELQNSLKILEFNAKEKYEREKLEMIQKQSDMKHDVDSLKNDYHQKITDLEYQRKILVEEKNFFEKYKEEAIK